MLWLPPAPHFVKPIPPQNQVENDENRGQTASEVICYKKFQLCDLNNICDANFKVLHIPPKSVPIVIHWLACTPEYTRRQGGHLHNIPSVVKSATSDFYSERETAHDM